ncbi:hypothetical protein ACLBPJ_29740, partial [Klebsiella pneumoniae]
KTTLEKVNIDGYFQRCVAAGAFEAKPLTLKYWRSIMLKNWLLFLFLPILSIACQPAHAVEVGITKKSCNVAVNLSQNPTAMGGE